MNWIVSSLLMVFGSVCLYLSVRKSSLLKLPTQFNNLAMFAVPLGIYAIIGTTRQLNFSISLPFLGIIFLAAAFFSYLANVTSLKSIELAPNPGYSLVISKSYVVFTTIFSYLFLQGEITPRKALAIVIIILFSALIAIDPRKTKAVTNNNWLWYTLYSFVGWGLLSLTIKFLTLRGIPTLVMLTYLYIFVTSFIGFEIFWRKIKIMFNRQSWYYFGLIGVSSAVFNYFNFYSVGIAPNVGYVNAINAASISLVTIFSILLFGDEFSWRKLAGVFGVTIGIFLLLI